MSAKNILWRVLKRLVKQHNIEGEWNKTELTFTLLNGSVIMLGGVDASADERDKYLGFPLKLVYIDECASHRQELDELVYGVLAPTLIDHDGRCVLIGTPGNYTKGLFYRVTENKLLPKDEVWSVHKWSAYDNPYMAEKWAAKVEGIKKKNPLFMLTPLYKQHYLGQWVVDTSALIYKFDLENNTTTKALDPTLGWRYVLGVDLGWNDPTAFAVCAWSPIVKEMHVIETYQKSNMTFDQVAAQIQHLETRYVFDAKPTDYANKQGAETMNVRIPGLNLIPALKHDKSIHQDLMAADFIQRKIIVHLPACEGLADDYGTMVWEEDEKDLDEHGRPRILHKESKGCHAQSHRPDAVRLWVALLSPVHLARA